MKRIQKGFTLIELMIVVAIIGILAAVAIPAYQDYIVKAKLSKVVSTLDPVKTALAMYFQEQGGFPLPAAGDVVTSANAAAVAPSTSVWNSLGFGNYPSIPKEVQSMALATGCTTGPCTNIAIVLQLTQVKAGTIDGTYVSLSPIAGVNPTGQSTTSLAATDSIQGATAIMWNYGCNKGNATSGVTDGVVRNFFKNGNTVLTCA